METNNQLHDALKNGIVEVTFLKKDGSTRVMNCTLHESFLPILSVAEECETKAKTKNPNVTTIWSTEDGEWRCFRNDSLVSWKALSE